ncbi:MAG: phosphoribosylglycinamide synthetase C domain-containing protein, partial [bacterium]|nr:phosphoribosylglycinamide synthetase C domain-containing protein [bacterium]
VIVEELLTGYELSFMVLTDGTNVLPLLPAMDHKPVFDNDKGPNTGGMGAVAPLPMVTEQLQKRILAEIICPILDGLRSQGIIFRGCLYAGLMITRDGPKVLEFNCRFGDPELQPLALLIESDIVPVFQAIARGSLDGQKLAMSKDAAVCVVMTSGGYPNKYQKKKEIIGLDRALDFPDSDIFFAGVVMEKERLLSDGGRVLSAVAKAKDVPSAIGRVYQLVSQISWEGEHHRGDIGQKVLANGIQLELRRS